MSKFKEGDKVIVARKHDEMNSNTYNYYGKSGIFVEYDSLSDWICYVRFNDKNILVYVDYLDLIEELTKEFVIEVNSEKEFHIAQDYCMEFSKVVGGNWNNSLHRNLEINKVYFVLFSNHPSKLSNYNYENIWKNLPLFTFQEFINKTNYKQDMTTHKVTREDFRKIYAIACSTWKDYILEDAKKYIQPLNSEGDIPESRIKEYLDASDPIQFKALKEIFTEYDKEFKASDLKIGEIMKITRIKNSSDTTNVGKSVMRIFGDILVNILSPNDTWTGNLDTLIGQKYVTGTQFTITAK